MGTDDKSMNVFLTFIGLGISAAVVQCAIIQNTIQKDNIKIQLFDKRYKVYQSVLNSITLIKRDNWDRYILFRGNDINQQFLLVEDISVPLKSGQININQTIPEKGKN